MKFCSDGIDMKINRLCPNLIRNQASLFVSINVKQDKFAVSYGLMENQLLCQRRVGGTGGAPLTFWEKETKLLSIFHFDISLMCTP